MKKVDEKQTKVNRNSRLKKKKHWRKIFSIMSKVNSEQADTQNVHERFLRFNTTCICWIPFLTISERFDNVKSVMGKVADIPLQLVMHPANKQENV